MTRTITLGRRRLLRTTGRVSLSGVPRDPSRPSTLVVVLVVLIGLGSCALAVGAIAPDLLGSVGGWRSVAGGEVVVLAALAVLWIVQRRRDRTLR